MTNEEFLRWSRRLFVQYPSLWEWLERNSPDATATLALWRESLWDYSEDECNHVLDLWRSGRVHPFEAYERDKVPLIVRNVVDGQRQKQRSREEAAARRASYSHRLGLRGERAVSGFISGDSPNAAAFTEGQPWYRKFLEGGITRAEWERKFEEIFERHCGNSNSGSHGTGSAAAAAASGGESWQG